MSKECRQPGRTSKIRQSTPRRPNGSLSTGSQGARSQATGGTAPLFTPSPSGPATIALASGQRVRFSAAATAVCASGGYAQVRTAVPQATLPPEVARTYLVMVQRMQREQRTQTLASALRQLIVNPSAADMFDRSNAPSALPSLRQAHGAMTLRSIVADSTNLAEVRVNGRRVVIDDQGQFRTSIPVEPGATETTLTMTDEQGGDHRTAHHARPHGRGGRSGGDAQAAQDRPDDRGGTLPRRRHPDARHAGGRTSAKSARRCPNGSATRRGCCATRPRRRPAGRLRTPGREVNEQDQVMVNCAGHGYKLAETGAGWPWRCRRTTTSCWTRRGRR
ncbi:hypothetical protein [Azospirillum sp. TSO35-2]|uniref:hypothetical protein n=1 Tax=Azospirillum sp. TSO35-2 TaxID=716796 RepID=UPI0018EEB132|nr:hypothetical protein [Azospirillum sp. TSO35-2]